jgi:hypothetical protein
MSSQTFIVPNRQVTDKTPTASVVICAYSEQRWDGLVGAMESARAQTFPATEVVLVIDHNGRLLRRARASFPQTSYYGRPHFSLQIAPSA